MFIDIHCHLDLLENQDEVVKRAKKNKVEIIVANSVDFPSAKKVIKLSKKYPEVKAAIGIYPTDALKLSESEIKQFLDFARSQDIVAVGEVGMDFKESENKSRQEQIFSQFIQLSTELNIPVIVHSRAAEAECVELLEKHKAKKVIMHYFCGRMKLVDKIIANGWNLSIPTAVAYSKQFQEVVKIVPIENLFCETDSPYSHPKKEFPNEPANVVESYKKIAEIKGLPLKEVEKFIEGNFKRVFENL